jgi:hypothetical protein
VIYIFFYLVKIVTDIIIITYVFFKFFIIILVDIFSLGFLSGLHN